MTGNEDGAHHVINEVAGALNEVGFTIPAEAWTYWNKGPGPGPSYLEGAAAQNLGAAARALAERPMAAPPS